MRNKIFILLLLSLNLIFGSCKKTTSDIIEDTQDNSPPYTVTIDSIVDPFIGQLPMLRNTRMMGRTVPFIQDNKEFFLAGGTQWCGNTQHTILPLLLFGNQNGKWSLLSELSSVQMGEFRNWEYLPDGSGFVVAETGPEWCDITWPYGHIYLVRFKNGGLEWTKVSQNKSFYHDVSAGDINGDGILDIVGSHMGTRNGNTDNPHIYLGKADGTFQEQINVLPRTPSGDDGGDVEIFDIDKDGVNEIVHTGSNTTYTQEVYAYFKYNKQQNAYTKAILMNKSIPQNLPTETYDDTRLRKFVYNNFKGYMPAGKRFHDFNKDGQLDFIQERDGLTVWYGEGGGNFRAARINEQGKQDPVTQLPIFPNYNMSGYEIIDLEGDKDPDVIPVILNFGNMNNITEIDLSRMIFINDGGTFKRLNSQKYKIPKAEFIQSTPTYLQPFIRDGKLHFRGYLNLYSYPDFRNIRYVTIKTNIRASYWY